MTNLGHASVLLIIGIVMIGLTVVVNTVGVVLWLRHLGREIQRQHSQGLSLRMFRGILTTAIVLLMLHVVEALMWAVLYMLLPGQSGLGSLHDAFYFSIVTFTTLGYGDVTLTPEWQLLSGLESMVGILLFGMTTALMFAVVQKSWQVTRMEKIDVHDG